MRTISGLFLFLLIPLSTIAQSYTISGFVKDIETGEVLINANIYNSIAQNGAVTNEFGFFSYTTSVRNIALRFSYIGYKSQEIEFTLDSDTSVVIELMPGGELEEILVTHREDVEEVTQMSRIDIPVQQINDMPRLLGEVDVLKSVQLLPGVQSGTEGFSGIYVRGGGPDQNLFLLDGVPVYNPSHLAGFFSTFNADAINNVSLIKGGFPAKYGGRLSSVLDISLKEGNTEKIQGNGSVGLISSKLTIDGPLSDKTTFLISGRRTYADLIARPIIKELSDGEVKAAYFFHDINAKVNHRFNNKNRVYLSAYQGKDDGFLFNRTNNLESVQELLNQDFYESISEEETGLEWGNTISSLRWNHIFSPKIFSNFTLTYSKYNFEVYNDQFDFTRDEDETIEESSALNYFSGIEDIGAKLDVEFNPVPTHKINFGINSTWHSFNPGAFEFDSNFEADTVLDNSEINSTEYHAYLEDDISLSENLNIRAGIHVSGLQVQSKNYFSFEPRFAFNYQTPWDFTLKGSFTKMAQYVHLLTNSGLGLPTDLWVPSTSKVKPQESVQYSLGIAKNLGDFDMTLEGYYKTMKNLIEYKEGSTFVSTGNQWEEKITSGEGEAYGMEFFLQKKYGRWNGWLGYTLAWNNRTFEELNFGRTFPYKYDRRHDVNAVFQFKPKKGVQYSLNWVFGSGNTVTLPTNKSIGINNPDGGTHDQVEYFDNRNGYRMGAYHRLDVSASWTKPKKWGERTWTIGIYNAYYRQNPFYVDIVTRYEPIDETGREVIPVEYFEQYSLFPIIPSITYSFKF